MRFFTAAASETQATLQGRRGSDDREPGPMLARAKMSARRPRGAPAGTGARSRQPLYARPAAGARTPHPVPSMNEPRSQHTRSWVVLVIALAVHVLDEALTNFLEFYNPLVLSMRARSPWFPMPTFTFEVWLAGCSTRLDTRQPHPGRASRWRGQPARVLGVRHHHVHERAGPPGRFGLVSAVAPPCDVGASSPCCERVPDGCDMATASFGRWPRSTSPVDSTTGCG